MNEINQCGCCGCPFLAGCGGLDGELDLFGCAVQRHDRCGERGWTCFCNPRLLAERYSEVGGFHTDLKRPLVNPSVAGMPIYVPTIYHASSRTETLDVPWVALPLDSVIALRRDGQFRPIASNGASLREKFRLSPKTSIIVTSVRPDPVIEQFWSYHRIADAPALLTALDIQAITVPNFSFFDDCPRPHIIYNWSRMLRIAERFSAAGLGTILHLNALTKPDWRRWERILRDQPETTLVCKEFQTGLRVRERGDSAYGKLVDLQARLGRQLHPVLLAGRRFLPKLANDFPGRFTVIDATPFMRTYYRRGLESTRSTRLKWRARRSAPGESVHRNLAETIYLYHRKLEQVAMASVQHPELAFKVAPCPRPSQRGITPAEDFALSASVRASRAEGDPANTSDERKKQREQPSRNIRDTAPSADRKLTAPRYLEAATPPS